MMKNMEKFIASTIEKTVRAEFSDLTITNISVEQRTDYNDDTVYHVTVVFDSKGGLPDPKKMSGLVRHVRSEIENQSENFPIFRFISQSDAKRIGIATA